MLLPCRVDIITDFRAPFLDSPVIGDAISRLFSMVLLPRHFSADERLTYVSLFYTYAGAAHREHDALMALYVD